MKTLLQFLPAFFAASVPVSLAVELTGFHLPAGADFLSVFSAFVMALVALIAVGDYSRPRRALVARVEARTEKAAHPLAA